MTEGGPVTPVEVVAGVLHDAFQGDTDIDLDRLAAEVVDRLSTYYAGVVNERGPTYARSGRGSKLPYPGGRPPGSR
jgi:hypothetical protein